MLDALFTVWVRAALLLGTKEVSPLYCTVMLRCPPLSVLIVKVAWPEPFRATAGVWVTPSTTRLTVPVGVPALATTGRTVAVKVAVCPNTVGFTAETTEVVVAARTDWVRLPVLVLKLLLGV